MREIAKETNKWAGSNPVASVYLKRSGDERNKMMLTDRSLVVIYNGREFAFDRESCKKLEVGYKKYLFPLIVGGILLPLSFLAMAGNDFNPFFLILFLLAGFYLLYAGWSGSPVLTVVQEPKAIDFSLFHISDNLKAFIAFANAYMITNEKPEEHRRYIFIDIEKKLWDHFGEMDFDGPKIILGAMTWDQWHRENKGKETGKILLMIDLFKIRTKVLYEYEKTSHELRPVVEWPVNREAISEYPYTGKDK